MLVNQSNTIHRMADDSIRFHVWVDGLRQVKRGGVFS